MRTIVLATFILCSGTARAGSTGSVTGAIAPAPKHAVVWLEGIPKAAWTLPKREVTMSQRGARFSPEFMVLIVGQTLRLPNDDRMTHNVFSVSPPKKFDLGHYGEGEMRSVLFDKPGLVQLYCNIHENMHATVAVAPSTFFTEVSKEGRFTIAGVPPGKYTLVAVSADESRAEAPVTVADGATTIPSLSLKGR